MQALYIRTLGNIQGNFLRGILFFWNWGPQMYSQELFSGNLQSTLRTTSKKLVLENCLSILNSRGGGSKINIFLRIYLLPFKKLCMVVSSSKIFITDGAANGHQNWNIMKLAHVIHHWKRNLMLINFYKRSMPLKWIVFKLYAVLTIQQHRWYTW